MISIKKKLPELQVLSGIAILFVILIHINSYYLINILELQSYSNANFTSNLLDNFIHGAVPMFIFASGYKYALNKSYENYKIYVIKSIRKVIKPFLIISLIFILINFIKNPNMYQTSHDFVVAIINMFIGHNIAYQLWYIPVYIFIVLTYPVLYRAFKNDKFRILMIILIMIIQRNVGYDIYLLGRLRFRIIAYYFSFVSYYLFFEQGVLFCKYNIKDNIKKWDIHIIALYIIMTFVLATNDKSSMYELIRLYLLWPLSIVAYYLISFKLCKSKILLYLGKYSFYIFLLHEPIILQNVCSILMAIGKHSYILFISLSLLLTLIITLSLYIIIHRIYIKYNKIKYKKRVKIAG